MPGSRPIAAFVLGVAIAGLVAAVPAWAEQRPDTTIAAPPSTRPKAAGMRPTVLDPLPEDPVEVPPTLRPAVDVEAPEDGGEARDHPTLVDGVPLGAQQPLDGVIEVGEPLPSLDGAPDPRREAPSADYVAAFERPPAGYDPYLFQIELEPLSDRRTVQLFRLEPEVARGIRIGSFVLFPEAEIGALATNNVFRTSPPSADHALDLRGTTRLVSDWRTHAVELRAGGVASFYDTFPSEDDRTYVLEARGRLDLSRRTNVEALVSHQLDRATRSSRDEPADAAGRAEIETNRAAAALNHRFNRLALHLRGSVTEVDFSPVASVGGGIISNRERDFTQRDAAARASWALSRKADVFAETAIVDREFHAAPSDGVLRTSSGERYRLGLAFNAWDARLRGEVSAGWGRQVPKDGRLDAVEGVIFDANLAWRASALTTFLLTASSDFYDSTVAGSAGALSRSVGLEARHAFRRHLFGTAGVKYAIAPYEGVVLTERSVTGELGLEYYVSRDVILYGRYQHVAYDSTAPNSDYNADILRLGVRVRR